MNFVKRVFFSFSLSLTHDRLHDVFASSTRPISRRSFYVRFHHRSTAGLRRSLSVHNTPLNRPWTNSSPPARFVHGRQTGPSFLLSRCFSGSSVFSRSGHCTSLLSASGAYSWERGGHVVHDTDHGRGAVPMVLFCYYLSIRHK